MTTRLRHDNVEKQFGSQTNVYLASVVHASGRDLLRLGERLSAFPQARVLGVGCGVGHASFVATQHVRQIMAYDLSLQMLEVVTETMKDGGLENIATCQGYAKSLPFENNESGMVISHYSAHHWHNVGCALREANCILKPDGILIMMDVTLLDHPVRNIWSQTVKALCDTSHVHNYSSGEWLPLVNDANLTADILLTGHLPLGFSSWVARMHTPAVLSDTTCAYQQDASADAEAYFALQEDGSFTSDTIMVGAHRVEQVRKTLRGIQCPHFYNTIRSPTHHCFSQAT